MSSLRWTEVGHISTLAVRKTLPSASIFSLRFRPFVFSATLSVFWLAEAVALGCTFLRLREVLDAGFWGSNPLNGADNAETGGVH